MEAIKRAYIADRNGKAVIVFADADGHETFFAGKALRDVFNDLNRKLAAHESQQNRLEVEWKFVRYFEPQRWNVGTIDDGRVAVIVDQGLPTEQTLALSSDQSAEVGRRLIEEAERATPAPQGKPS